MEANACGHFQPIEYDVEKRVGLSGGSKVSYEEVQFGCTLVGEGVGKTEAIEESGTKDDVSGCATGVAGAL